ncbi:MAG: hypothetical protein C4318_00290 [Acidimicrobiia bacterium]
MTPQQVLVIAIPVIGAVFVLFVVLVATSRRRRADERGSEDLTERFAAALDAVPGGFVEEEDAASRTSVPSSSSETPPGQGPKEKVTPMATALLTEAPSPPLQFGEKPSGDGHKSTEVEIVEPKIKLRPIQPAADEEVEGMTRRQVLNRGILLTLGASLTSFGGAVIAFLWPRLSGGFGSVIAAGNMDEIKSTIKANREPFYSAAGRFYLMTYETNLDDATGESIYPKAFTDYKQAGLIAMYQKCPHLGCKVPWCKSSQWFECPCHGSKYNAAGEWQGGPAPRGMWHFPIKVQGGTVMVDTGKQITGAPKGTNTPVDPLPKGPHCVGI